MQGNRKNHQPDPHNQTEKLKTPLLDLGPGVKEISLSNGNRLIYRSAVMRRLIEEEVRIFAPLPCDILIIAETGTGKELIAQAIHEQSERKGLFIDLNCAAIPEHLAESLLFGHVKGAFTGATENTKGIFEQAEGGTVALDEFGELAPACQAKLLRVLQERKIKRVGRWGIDVPVDVRIVAATNREMRSMVMGGAFREDLIHRFDKVIMIPPLRERREDVLPLANYFINELLRKKVIKILPGLSLSAERALTSYHFPGNVRELKNIIFHAAVYAWVEKSPIIESVKIDEAIEAAGWRRSEAECVATLQKETRPEIAAKTQSLQGALFLRLAEIETADDERMRDVLKALRENGGDHAKAAQAMGITRQAMGYHIKKLVKKLLAGVDYRGE
jgi:transcriptional regulator with GAF, ATPase, and Fis domain